MEPRPTLHDIAKLANVGKATVSLALRNHPKISEATRKRVQQIAEQLRYRPDPALARIAAHRWKSAEHPSDPVVAYVCTGHPWDAQAEVCPDARAAAVEHGERLGYRVETFRLQDYPGPAQLGRVLFHRGIRGVIFSQIMAEAVIKEFPWENFTCVGCHVGYYRPPVHLVMPDFHHSVLELWRRAVNAGYKRIGVAMLREMQAVDLFDKVSAALFCQLRLTPELPAIPVEHFEMKRRDEFARWMRMHRPDVVLGFNATVAWWLEEAGYIIPRDVAFLSIDTAPGTQHEGKVVSGMNPDFASIGRMAMDQLDLLLRNNHQGIPMRPITVQVPSEWIPGETMPRAAEIAGSVSV